MCVLGTLDKLNKTHGRARDRRGRRIGKGCATSGAMLTGNHQDLFSTALIAYLPRLRRYATALAGSVSVADDLVQDCVERALRRADTLNDPQRMAGWLRSILLHLYMDMLRLQLTRGTGVDLTLVDNDIALSVPPPDPRATIEFIRAIN